MTAVVDLANRALNSIGTRSQITSLTEDSNEAKSANLWFDQLRDELLRMAPWNCATNYNTIEVLKAAPGTPENPTQGTTVWDKATQPPPPWAYEYAYPSNCLRALWIVPQFNTGFASGIPITTAVTGFPSYWNGPPVRFKRAIDQDAHGNDINVILTNQQQAILVYIKEVTNPDVWDVQFQQAFVAALAARLCFNLTGDKALSNSKIAEANTYIAIARAGDGNEGLTINNVTPDFIRIRGIDYPSVGYQDGMSAYDWGPMLAAY